MAKKYEIRINYIPQGTVGEGQFWWITEEQLLDYQKEAFGESHYGINNKHWSTVCFEEIPYLVLPKLTGKNNWVLGEHKDNNSTLVFAYFGNADGDTVIVELQDQDGCCGWDKEDIFPDGPALTVFTPDGKITPCSNAREAAETVCREIFFNCGPNRNNAICVKR